MFISPLPHPAAVALAVVVSVLLAGCAEPALNTQTQYLYPPGATTTTVSRSSKPMPHAPAPVRHTPRKPVESEPAVKPVEPALPTTPGTPHLKSTPPTLRDRTGAPALTSAEPTPVAEKASSGLAGSGDFTIDYVNGAITKVSILRKTGHRELDRRSTTWIWAKFRVRPGATGQSALTLTWREDRDRPTPKFHPI